MIGRGAGWTAWMVGALATAPIVGVGQVIDLTTIGAGVGNGFAIDGEAAFDWFGRSVLSAGDVNGDGLGDLIVGNRQSSPGGRPSAGAAFVVFGSGDPTPVSLTAIAAGVSSRGFVIRGVTSNDRTAQQASAAGDVNGDGLSDIIVGAGYAVSHGLPLSGRAWVVFGRSETAPIELSDIDPGTSTLGFAMVGCVAHARAGLFVSAAGDVNGDGLADVAVASPLASGQPPRCHVIFGKASGATIQLSDVTAGTTALGFDIRGADLKDVFLGVGLASAGDVNGDGLSDVIIGSPNRDAPVTNNSDAGRAYVVFGKSDSAQVELSDVAAGAGGGWVMEPEAPFSECGRSVSGVGDVNGDGLADVAVAAHLFDLPGAFDTGRAHVVFGRTATTPIALSDVTSGLGGGFVINGLGADEHFGSALSGAGDMNGDGLPDLVVGAQRSSPAGRTWGGRTYVVLGKSTTTPVNVSDLVGGGSPAGFPIIGEAASDYAGGAVGGAGDVNGDGVGDVIIGAGGNDISGTQSGRAYVVFSPLAPATAGMYKASIAPGDGNRAGIGATRYGDDRTQFVDARAWLDFDGGSGPGPGGASTATVTLTRNDSGIAGFAPANLVDAQWLVDSDRTGWNNCAITVRYTDAELDGIDELSLLMFTAPTPAGPFTQAPGFVLDHTRNEATGVVTSLPAVVVLVRDVFIPIGTIARLEPSPTANQMPTWSVTFSEDIGASFGVSDIVPTGTLAAGAVVCEVTGSSSDYVVRVGAPGQNVSGTLGFQIPGGVVEDPWGNPLLFTAAQPYSINEGAGGGVPGDVDKNSVVDVADVTLLADHIVNGTPLP